MACIADLHKKWLKDPKNREAFDALDQGVRARRGGDGSPESRRAEPMRTLERLADATGSRLQVSFTPNKARQVNLRFPQLPVEPALLGPH